MTRSQWLIGGLCTAAGFATVWFAVPRDVAAPTATAITYSAPDSEKDAFGNLLTGEEYREPIAEVIEVIDLTQVFEPKPGADQPHEFGPAILDVFCWPLPGDFAAPVRMPYASEPDGTGWVFEVGNGSVELLHAPRYGEETSEPPVDPSHPRVTFAMWFQGACAEILSRAMPLKGVDAADPE